MHKPRKLALAVLASITIAGIAGASASSLGGLDGASVGSDDTITASCQTTGQIAIAYSTTYNSTLGRFDIGTVDFSNVNAACDGLTASVVLADGSNAALSSGSTSVVLSGGTFSIDVTDVSAEAVEKLSLVIQG